MAEAVPRRTFLALPLTGPALVGLAGSLAGCTDDGVPAPMPSHRDPDEAVLASAVAGVSRLLAAYASTSAAAPALRTRLAVLAAEHDAHLAVLRERLPTTGASPTATGAAPSSPAAAPARNPRRARTALATLEERESARRGAEAQRASPELARLLASIAAAEAVHAALLRRAS
jgi:hypothetical protein